MPKGIYQHKKGYKMKDTSKMNVSKKGTKHTEKTLQKMRKPRTEESRNNMKGHCGAYKRTPEMKTGKYERTEEHRKIYSEARMGEKNPMYGKRLELSSNWQNGISFEPYTIDWTNTLRQSIRERDRYTCQLCSKPQGDRLHSVHHIDYDKLNCNPNNLITLCVGCNTKVNYNRKYWQSYFQKLKT